MAIAFALLLTTHLIAPASAPVQQDPPAAPVQQAPSQSDSGGTATSTDRPHQIGLGGFGGSGGGVSFRYFMTERIGLDANVGFSGAGPTGSRNSSSGTTVRVAPSAVFMMTKAHALADLDVRPYVGGGLNYTQTPSNVQAVTTGVGTSGFGMQAFGGVELSFASARSIAISAEVAYYHLAVQPINLISTSGTDFYLLFHYYMK